MEEQVKKYNPEIMMDIKNLLILLKKFLIKVLQIYLINLLTI